VSPAPVLPDYGGACISSVVPALLGPRRAWPWLPDGLADARQIVLLVLDGLGWEQLQERTAQAPFLASMRGGAITSVTPTTTATALTSITTGLTPAEHDVVGYRVQVGDEVLNVLRWRTAAGDARQAVRPDAFQVHPAFGGHTPPVVTRAEFASSGFSLAHLTPGVFHGWRMPSTLVGRVGEFLDGGEPFIYAYYDGIDKVAHEFGFGRYYDAELSAADGLVGDVAALLPEGAALVVTADHGQVEVGDSVRSLPAEVTRDVVALSGEGRFRWLHARPGTSDRLAEAARQAFGAEAWVRTVDELDADGWFGGPLSSVARSRLGDVALIAHAPVAFADPSDTGENRLRCRHGSLTSAEMLVPLLAVGPDLGQHSGRA
jgi:alkylated DNA repair dioxygenase AlkB